MSKKLNRNQNTEPDKRLIGSKDQIIELLPIGSNYSSRSGFLNSATDATETASLEELFNKVWSGKWTILIIVLVITTATLFFLQLTAPVFSAQALILIESREGSVENIMQLEGSPRYE